MRSDKECHECIHHFEPKKSKSYWGCELNLRSGIQHYYLDGKYVEGKTRMDRGSCKFKKLLSED